MNAIARPFPSVLILPSDALATFERVRVAASGTQAAELARAIEAVNRLVDHAATCCGLLERLSVGSLKRGYEGEAENNEIAAVVSATRSALQDCGR